MTIPAAGTTKATKSTAPAKREDHPHDHDHEQYDVDCPAHHERCQIGVTGYLDCPEPVVHHCVTEMITIPCGVDNPMHLIQAHLNTPGNHWDTVTQILDLGNDGWLVTLCHPV